MSLMSLPIFLALGFPALPDGGNATDLRCGGYCLHVALGALGLYRDRYEVFEKQLGPPTPQGYSLARLEEVARRHGAQTLIVATTLPLLRRHERPFCCIAHLQRGHFVLLQDVTETTVRVIDPLGAPEQYDAPHGVFAGAWSGEVLLLSDRPITTRQEIPWGNLLGTAILALCGLAVFTWLWRRSRRR